MGSREWVSSIGLLLLERDSTQEIKPKGSKKTRRLFICIAEKSRSPARSRAQNYSHGVPSSPSLNAACFFVGFILWHGLAFVGKITPSPHPPCSRFRVQVSGLNPSSTFIGQITVSIPSLIHVSWRNVCFSLTPWEEAKPIPAVRSQSRVTFPKPSGQRVGREEDPLTWPSLPPGKPIMIV